jgi:para-aminobenzoate synthetase/4-amino-4-deoxychorismate lyase
VSFELLETLRWTPHERWFLLERHLDRLEKSARHFHFAYSRSEILGALDRDVQSATEPLRVRLRLARDGATRVEHAPLDRQEGVWRLRLARDPIDPSDEFLYHKTTNRALYERALQPGCDDVVLWNRAREITETTIANLVIESVGGRRVTPPVACGLLPGVFRAELLASGEVTEAVVTIDQLKGASRVWLVNSVRGWLNGSLLE